MVDYWDPQPKTQPEHPSPLKKQANCCAGEGCCSAPASTVLHSLEKPSAPVQGQRARIRIQQMCCPAEEALIRKKLGPMPEVRELQFNLLQRTLTLVHAPGSLDTILQALRSLGFAPEAADTGAPPVALDKPDYPGWRLGLAGLCALAAEGSTWFALPPWLSAALAIVAVLTCGLGTYRKGWTALRNRDLNINALMSIAVTGALALGRWPEAAMVMLLFQIAEWLEDKSLDRARHAIEGLLRLAPEKATVQQPDGSWREMEAAAVPIGSLVRVRPGERIALDGQILHGRSAINQAPITGESLPVDKAQGDAVFAGTINTSGSFDYRATAGANNSTLARIIHAVEQAQSARAPSQQTVDRFARIYTPTVFVIALVVALVPPLLLAGGWYEWVYKALVLLVIACPCALVIATPVTMVSALTAAARQGILIKGGVYLEQARQLRWLVLDKTGTLTHGRPRQTDFEALGEVSQGDCLRWAASLAARSDHPVSQAISQAVEQPRQPVQNFQALPGLGVRGEIDGHGYWLGNHRLLEQRKLCSPTLEMRIEALERQGKTVVALGTERRVLALFAVADTLKESSREAIAELHRLGLKTLLLSGDNNYASEAIAGQAGIDRALGNQLPEDKLAVVEELAQQAKVGMVGDGINDAPALARAHIGVAMGAMGSDAAIETADVALMDDDLCKIPALIRLSRITRRVLVQNISLAIGLKAVFLLLTLVGLGNMWMAVFADVGTTVLVVANGMRLLRK